MNLTIFFIGFFIIQLIHSIEKLATGFPKSFPFFKINTSFVLAFDLIFFGFGLLFFFDTAFPSRLLLMKLYILVIFLNGFWHIVWSLITKKYQPGFYSAWLSIVLFFIYFFKF